MNMNFDVFNNCGQEFFVINNDKWNLLKKEGEYDGIKFGSDTLMDTITNMVNFAENHDGFCCAISKASIGKIKYFWNAILFYYSNIGWTRVRIESTGCTKCEWQGYVANPQLTDLYDTVVDKFNEIKKVSGIQEVFCPICNSRLKRYAIWVD